MKIKTTIVFDTLSKMRDFFQFDSYIDRSNKEEPFRSELYSIHQMQNHAKVMASSHKMLDGKSVDKLLKRLDDNEKTLLIVRNLLVLVA